MHLDFCQMIFRAVLFLPVQPCTGPLERDSYANKL